MARTLVSWFLALALVVAIKAAPAIEVTTIPASNSTATSWVRQNEGPCLRSGGICVLEVECPAGQLSNTTGLCPEQQAAGVECCHGLSVLERRCSARGGVCRPKQKCGRGLWEKRGDCATDETCCILV